ncbi:MAG: HAD family hydrolase [Deltaproteobacteria bacterium]|nr:HAD family hydrolase [Deltaproteobacteria bacterium]
MAGRIAAFFDLDNTLVDSNTGRLYVNYLRKHVPHELRLRDALRTLTWLFEYKLHLIDQYEVTERALTLLKGMNEGEMSRRCQHWFDTMVAQKLFPVWNGKIAEHRARGHLTSILTASTRYAAIPVARHLGIDEALFTALEVRDGIFTGATEGPPCHGPGKVYWAKKLADEKGIDLAQSYFYTDSIHDIEMLEVVAHPICVNPDRKLARVARDRGWEILKLSRR